MRGGLSWARARGRVVVVLSALFVGALVSPGQAAAAAPVQWCGNDVATGDRYPDAIGGNQIHVVYAYSADRANRLGELANGIATDLAGIDEWWRRHDPLRAPRYDTFPFPGCQPGFGQLDISAVQLARPATAYDFADANEVAQAVYGDLIGSSFGSLREGKKYLVVWDAPVPSVDACAFSVEAVNVFWYLLEPPMPGCPPVDPGAQTYAAMVIAHELVHNLGAVRTWAPHECLGAHVCEDERDLLHGIPLLRTLEQSILDVGNDDYYGHSSRWTDVQDSPFLYRTDMPRHVLAVTVDPPVGGTVWTEEPGIACPPHCSAEWESGGVPRLRAQAQSGYRFVGWSGSCGGRLSRCRPTVSAATSVTASFTGGGSSSSGSTSPGVRNRAPRARIADMAKYSYEVGEAVSFASASTDSDGTITSVEWDFGDGTKATGPTATHVFGSAARFRVTLRVTDDRGAVDDSGRSLNVRADPPRVYLSDGFGRYGDTIGFGFRVSDRTALARFRVRFYVGRRIVMRRTLRVAGARTARGSISWRAPITRKPLKWCGLAVDVFGHSTNTCTAIRLRPAR